MENIYKVLKGKAKEKISLGRPRCKLEKKILKWIIIYCEGVG